MIATAVLALMVLVPTDQTVNVAKGTKLDVNNYAGDVNVKVWNRDAVRVEVNHSDRETVDIRQDEGVLRVRGRSTRGGPPRSLDYTITVPAWMAVSVSGTYADVTLDGVGGDVSIETTRGDIDVKGGSGYISLKSVQGEIALEKAKGRIEIRAVNEGIHLTDISGDLSAETTNGSILLTRVDSGNVDLYTVNGDISYDGPIKAKGVYRLTTHSGTIAMALPDKVDATLMVRTYNGSFHSTFPIKLGEDQNPRKRFTLTLGSGSAHIELESFGGAIALRRPGEPRPEMDRERRRREHRMPGRDDVHAAIADAMRDIQPQIDAAMRNIQPTIDEAMRGIQPQIDEAMRHVKPAVDDAMREIQPGIDAAIEEAMGAVHRAMPHPHPVPVPRIR